MRQKWPQRGSSLHRKWTDQWYVRGGIATLFVIAVAAIVITTTGEREDEPEDAPPQRDSLVAAVSGIGDALSAARRQHDQGEAAALVEERREQEMLHAEWNEGEAVEMAGELEPGQSVYLALLGRNVPDPQIFRALTSIEEEFDFRRSRPGDRWRAWVDEEGRITELRYETSPEDVWLTRIDDEGAYHTEKLDIDVEVRTEAAAGTVEGSFWLSMSRSGYSDALAFRFMRVFDYTIDFNTETRAGDHFAMIYEKIYLDDEFLRYGRILAATYLGEYGSRRAFYYESDDESGYFDEEGDSMQRQFLRSPLEVTRVTSTFGRRTHPITGDQRMHHGVDYGAPTGTRVRAVADGRVHFAGWRGGYGKLLILRHSGGYETRYAHLSRFESGIRAGARVSQGQVVARSGNTGASTAPHLHYEMLRNGQHINPLTVEATSGDPLRGQELADFKAQHVEPLTEKLARAFSESAPDALVAWQPDDSQASSDE